MAGVVSDNTFSVSSVLRLCSTFRDAFALFHWHFYCDSFTKEEDCIQNLLCTLRTFGNYWAFAVFSGPDLTANLSDGLK